MPKIPLYGRQAELPRTTHPFFETPEAKGRVGRAVQNLGVDLMKQSQKIRDERDELDVLEAIKSLSDDSRNFLMEARKQQGMDAVGATERAGQFYDDTIRRYANNMNPRVARKFRERSLSVRNGGMNTMASHESQQHQIRQNNAIKVVVDTFKQAMSDGAATEPALRFALQEMRNTVDAVYAGHDEITRDSIKKGTEQEMTRAWVLERAKFQPEVMYNDLEKYRTALPAPVFDQVKDHLKQKVDEIWVDNRFQEILVTNPGDHKAMMSEANQIKDATRRKKVVQRIKDDYATNKTFDEEAKKKAQDKILRDVVTTFGAKNYSAVRKMVLDNVEILEPGQVEHWVKTIDAIVDRELKEKEKAGPFDVSDDDILKIVSEQVNLRPKVITIWDIWKLHGKGLATKDCQRLQGILLRNKKKVPDKLINAFEIIKAWEKGNAFSSSKAENKKAANNLREMLEQFIEDHPEGTKDLVNDFLVPFHKDLKKQKFERAFQSFRDTFTTITELGGERQTYKIRKPEPRVSPFNEDKFLREWLGE